MNTIHTFKSPASGKSFEPGETLAKIQQVLHSCNYVNSDTALGDRLSVKLSQFNLMLLGIEKIAADDVSLDAYLLGFINAWFELENLIKQRETEAEQIWDLALHGEGI